MAGKRFTVEIAGSIKQGKDIDIFVRRAHASILKIDSDAQLEIINFARLNYKFVWTGIVKFINNVDNTYIQSKKYTEEFLEKWVYKILVEYDEKQGVA